MNDLRRLFDHMAWADDRVLRLLGDDGLDPSTRREAARLHAHILSAERVWLARIEGEPTDDMEIWPDPVDGRVPADLLAHASRVRSGYERVLGDALDRDRPVAYRNSRGESFETRLGDILLHVALHGSYHRGQIASAARRAECVPVNTDYITFVREGTGG